MRRYQNPNETRQMRNILSATWTGGAEFQFQFLQNEMNSVVCEQCFVHGIVPGKWFIEALPCE